jgi:hypothetical protein
MKKKLGNFFHKMKIFQKKGASMNMNLYLGFRKAANFNYLDAVQRIQVKKYKLGLLGKSCQSAVASASTGSSGCRYLNHNLTKL